MLQMQSKQSFCCGLATIVLVKTQTHRQKLSHVAQMESVPSSAAIEAFFLFFVFSFFV